MKMMFSSYYYYLHFLCLYLYLNVVAQGAGNDKPFPTKDSFEYQRIFTASPTEVPRWKSTAKATADRQVNYSSSEDTYSGMKNKGEKNKNLLFIDNDSIKEAKTKVFSKRDANEKEINVETLPTFQANSFKSLADFFKDSNVTSATHTSNLNMDFNRMLDANKERLYLKQNEINLQRRRQYNNIVEVTSEEELTAEDRYPNFVPTENNIVDVGAKPNLVEFRVKDLEKDFGFPEIDKNDKTAREDGNKADTIQEGTIAEHLEMPDDKFTTVKANQEIIYDPNKSNVTLKLEVLGESFKAFLDVLNEGTFMPNAQVTVHDKENSKNSSISNLKDYLHMYEGSLKSKSGSYVCGSIVDSCFTGILMLENGTVWYVERPKKNDPAGKSTSVKETEISFHNCSHMNSSCHEVMLSGCKRKGENEITCFEGLRQERNEKLNSTKRLSTSNATRSHSFSSASLRNASCVLELVLDPSRFVEVHNQSILHALRELLTVILQANHILNQVDFDGDGEPENLNLRIGHAAMYASYRDEGPASNKSVMDQKLNTLLQRPQNSCLSLMFISRYLPDEEPVSITYGGSLCQGSLNKTRPPMNVAVVNIVGPKSKRRALLPMSLRVTETIGQMMGSMEETCENPFVDPSSRDSWFSFFPNCTRQNMIETLASRGSCLESHQYHHTGTLKMGKHSANGSQCGNGILDSGEECDCGNDCQKNYSCCVPSGSENECQFDRSKGCECEWTDPCCTMSCKIVPKEWKKFCGNGDPSCGPKDAYCDGNSSACPHHQPDPSASDGHRCGPGNLEQVGAGTCKKGHCDSTVCRDAGLVDCHCAHKSHKTCKVCCKKKEKAQLCLPAEDFGLKSNASNFFYRYPGLPCSTVNNEYCDSMGTCTSKLSGSGQTDVFFSTLIGKEMSTTTLIVWTVLWRVMSFRLV